MEAITFIDLFIITVATSVACQGHLQRLDQEHHTVVVQLPLLDRLLRCLTVLLELLLHHYRHHQSQYRLVCLIVNPQHQCGLGKLFEVILLKENLSN